MGKYFEVLKGYITNGKPTYDDAQSRIDYGVAAGKLTPDEAEQLAALAQDNGVLVGIEQAIINLTERVAALESREKDPELPDDVIDWVPPTGAHDAPNIGDLRRYNGVIWRSLINGNTTVPGSDPRWWEREE